MCLQFKKDVDPPACSNLEIKCTKKNSLVLVRWKHCTFRVVCFTYEQQFKWLKKQKLKISLASCYGKKHHFKPIPKWSTSCLSKPVAKWNLFSFSFFLIQENPLFEYWVLISSRASMLNYRYWSLATVDLSLGFSQGWDYPPPSTASSTVMTEELINCSKQDDTCNTLCLDLCLWHPQKRLESAVVHF